MKVALTGLAMSAAVAACSRSDAPLSFHEVDLAWGGGTRCAGVARSYQLADGSPREVCLDPRPAFSVRPSDIVGATVREVSVWGGGDATLHLLEVRAGPEVAKEVKRLLKPHDRRMAVMLAGELLAVETTNRGWGDVLTVGAFGTRREAEAIALKLGIGASFEALTTADRRAAADQFEEEMRRYYWESACRPSAPMAKELEDEWAAFRTKHPALADSIDCDSPPQ